jgi:hypothetical protein
LTAIFRNTYGTSWFGANDIATRFTWVWDNGTTSGDNGLTDNLCGSTDCPNSNATWADGTRKWQNPNPNGKITDSVQVATCGYIWYASGVWDDVACTATKYAIIEFDL